MLTCENLTLTQGDFQLHADLSFQPGGITALVGPSGAGKSTLLSALAGFMAPSSGKVSYDGQDLTGTAPGARPISILFQDNNLFPHLTIGQNAGLALQPRLRLDENQKTRVATVLDQVGLCGMGDRKPASLSGGQQSRAALARVLLADRPVILLDEPFAALGPALRSEMLDLVQKTLLEPDRTVIMITHDPADAQRVATKTALVADGVVHPAARTDQLFAAPPPALAAYL